MSTFGKTARSAASAVSVAVFFGAFATAGAAEAAAPRLAGNSSYGPCYYNPIPCVGARQGKPNPYANLPLPNSKPGNPPATRH